MTAKRPDVEPLPIFTASWKSGRRAWMKVTGLGVAAVVAGCDGPGSTVDGGLIDGGPPGPDSNLDTGVFTNPDGGVPLPTCGLSDACYPTDATLIPWEDQVNAQRYLDEDAAPCGATRLSL